MLDLSAIKLNDKVAGVCLISKANVGTKKDGASYIMGNFSYKGKEVPFKVWDFNLVNSILGFINNSTFVNYPYFITGTVTEYNSILEIKVDSVQPKSLEEYPIVGFKNSLNTDSILVKFNSLVNENLSDNGKKLLGFLLSQENVGERFKVEQAAQLHHDNSLGGLLNHTTKMLEIGVLLTKQHSAFESVDENLVNYKDLFLLGLILHDIGKVWEMNLGEYTDKAIVTHRILGVMFLERYKNAVIELYNEDFYYQLCAVMVGHHGDYADPPKTVVAMLVHLVDMVDAGFTSTFEGYQKAVAMGSKTINVFGKNLRF